MATWRAYRQLQRQELTALNPEQPCLIHSGNVSGLSGGEIVKTSERWPPILATLLARYQALPR